jgi:tetratricopeptide (TPR) repeat protein
MLGVSLDAKAAAYDIDYAADRPEALRACDADHYRGDRAASGRCYSALLAGDTDVRIKAEAAWALGNVVAASDYFQEAFDSYPEDPRVRLRWGRLFAATNAAVEEVATLYREALDIDAAYAPAILAMAELAAGRFDSQAREWVDEVLGLDPDAIGAHLLLARMELEVGNIELAETSLDRAFELTEATAHPPLEVYALRASADLLRSDFESQWIDRALEYNPSYGDAYAIPAYFFVITRRYREAMDFYERAVSLQPDLYAAHVELGVNLLRDNRIAEALRHLEIARDGQDGFISLKTRNTGILIDSLAENFTVSTYDAETEPRGGGAGVILRLHNDETGVLTPYVLDLINESIETFGGRYGFTLEEPVIAELYPVAADFSVRTAGLPGIGLLGVTFGYLVAMNSPSQAGSGQFHWGTTLWHEIAHVFTLEATDHLVPRWFSEGVSVYEEWATGPLPGRHIPVHVLQAMSEDRFLPIADLDEGFIRPTYENQVIVSYMQAGLICEFIAASFGQRALQAMLERFRAGDETRAAIEAALAITPEEFDDLFADRVAAEFDPVLGNLEAWNEAQTELREHAAAGNWEGVLASAGQAVALMPDYVDEGSPYIALARAERELGDEGAARATLERYWRLGGYDPAALTRLARGLIDDGNDATAIDVLEALLLVTPLDESVHADLGDLLLEQRPADALTEFTALAALKPHDQASVNLRLAKAHRALGDTDKATEYLLYALEIAPHYREAQQLLLEIVR